jgi:hypothetical protein
MAVEQPHADLVFQIAYLDANRGLGKVQPRGSVRDAACFDDRREIA